jgi:renalase
MAVVVVGAGIAGLACARELTSAGIPARVLERDTVVGGRLASERLGGRPVDTGAAYVTADDPAFLGRLQSWRIAGLAHPWTDTFQGQHGSGTMRWSAPGGLRSLAEDLAADLDVTLGAEVTELPEADVVVLAMPGPQALRITRLAAAEQQQRTAVLTYPERTWDDFHGAFVNDDPVLTTVCDDGDRRGDRAPVLVAHSAAGFTGSGAEMAAAVGALLGIAGEPGVVVRDWPFATPRPGAEAYANDGKVFLCGDAFGRPRVQTAWQSGRAVARAIIEAQSTDR